MKKGYKLKWGIIGAGIIAHKMADALRSYPDCHLHAVASRTPSKAKLFAKENNIDNAYSYQEIVSDNEIDVIYVATTHNFHYENTLLALEHGKHVIVEKAFTVNAKEAGELVRLARKKKLFLMEAMWTRFLPSLISLKSKVTNNLLGEIKGMNVTFGGFVRPEYEKRLKEPSLAGGVTLDMGIYPISVVCYLLGELPIEIKSMTKFSDLGVDEVSDYMFRFPSGCLVNISTSYNLKMRNQADIYGSAGYVEFPDFHKGDSFTVFKHNGTNEIIETNKIVENHHENGFIYQVDEVVKCLADGQLESNIMPLDETVAIMEIIDKMRAEWGFKYPFE